MSNIKYCTCYFESKFAYLIDTMLDKPTDKNKILIEEYLNDVQTNKKIVCENGNELVLNSKKTKFRHKSVKYMTQWHKKWQDKFQNFTEINIGIRYADAIIHDIVLEFQHSYIEKSLVEARQKDYINHNKKLYWIIDCTNKCLNVKTIGDIYQIRFTNEIWKYKSFLSHDFIFLDYYDELEDTNKIFKINPNCVKSHMIDIRDYHTKKIFIEHLKKNIVDELFSNTNILKTTLYFNQRGAGCGKTYESIQLLQKDDNFTDVTTFIYLTKVHSAVYVIYNELMEQYKNNKLNIIITGEESQHYNNKKFKIKIENKQNGKKSIILIGTIDSFIYVLGNGKNFEDNSNDFFGGIAKNIRDGLVDLNYGYTKYGGINIELSKKCLVIIDEAQDLEPYYIEAICVIMRSTYINAYVIGDKLQSLAKHINTHTFLDDKNNELPNTKIIRNYGENIVRRFHNHHFIDFVNSIVNFDKFGCKPITKICDGNCKYIHKNDIPYNVFMTNPVYLSGNQDTDLTMNETIKYIISKLDYEVNTNNYLPYNFMFIFPILKNNHLANRLEVEIQNYWITKFLDENYKNNVLLKDEYWNKKLNNDEYNQYVYLHRSEDGKPIQLNESKYATRILSIHASKGNGCEVVFLLGLNEKSLKVFSKFKLDFDGNDIIYESLLHVALTRQKERLYVGLTNDNDDISHRFKNYCQDNLDVIPKIEYIKYSLKYSDVVKKFFSDENIDEHNILKKCVGLDSIKTLIEIDDNEAKKRQTNIVDWGHHILRYYVFEYYVLYNIHNNNIGKKNDAKKNSQFMAFMIIFLNSKIECYKRKKYYETLYNNIKNDKKNDNTNTNKKIPILNFDDSNGVCIKYQNIIKDTIQHIKNKIMVSNKIYQLPLLCPFEIIVFYYGLLSIKNGPFTDVTIMTLYNIIYCYDECSCVIDQKHTDTYNCSCSQYFKSGNNNWTTTYDDVRRSVTEFYKKTEQVNNTFNNFKNTIKDKYGVNLTNFHFNLYHPMNFENTTTTKNLKLWDKFNLIGYSKKYVLRIIIKPQLNKLNFNEIIFNIIHDVYFLSNISEKTNANNNYGNKQIIVCIFALDCEQPIFLSVDIDETFMTNIQKELKTYLISEYKKKHPLLLDFNEYCKKNNKIPYDEITSNENKEKYIKIPDYIVKIFEDLKDGEIEDSELLKKLNKKCEIRINDFFQNIVNKQTVIHTNYNVIGLDNNVHDIAISDNENEILEFKKSNSFIDEFIDD